jgi:hypothetical protein
MISIETGRRTVCDLRLREPRVSSALLDESTDLSDASHLYGVTSTRHLYNVMPGRLSGDVVLTHHHPREVSIAQLPLTRAGNARRDSRFLVGHLASSSARVLLTQPFVGTLGKRHHR